MDKETTALEAVTLAGGFTDRGRAQWSEYSGEGLDGVQETTQIDLTDPKAREVHLIEGENALRSRGNTFFVSGEVRKPAATSSKSTTAFAAR